jgi:hypothetical protein
MLWRAQIWYMCLKFEFLQWCDKDVFSEISGCRCGEYEDGLLLDIVPCSLLEVCQHSRGAYCLHHQGDEHPDDGGSKYLRNISKLLPDYTVQQPRRHLQ